MDDDPNRVAREASRRLNAFLEEIAGAAAVANVAEARLVALTARALTDRLWEGWRIHSPQQWLGLKLGVSRGTADKIVRLASRYDELPTVIALHTEGRLSLDQAATVARYTPAEYEKSVCDLALFATVGQITTATAKYCFDTVERERDERAKARGEQSGPKRSVRFGSTGSDQWSIHAHLPADEGAIVEEALKDQRAKLHDAARAHAKDLAEAEGRPTTGTDDELGVDQPGWADALVGIARVAATTDESGDAVSDRVGVLLHLKAPDPDDADAEQWRAEMHMGPTLPGALRRYLTCDCDIAIVWNQDGAPVQVGRTHRNIPRRIRRLVTHRDRTCRVPGCSNRLWLQVHQIVHWEDGGETTTANLLCLCSTHHRLHHQGHLGITGNADATSGGDVVTFTHRGGDHVSPAPHPRSADLAELPLAEPYKGPTGETLQKHWVHFDRTRTTPWRPPIPGTRPTTRTAP